MSTNRSVGRSTATNEKDRSTATQDKDRSAATHEISRFVVAPGKGRSNHRQLLLLDLTHSKSTLTQMCQKRASNYL